MFPPGLPTCKEEPAGFLFDVYSKYGNTRDSRKKVSKSTGYCNGNATLLEKLPVGTYTIPVWNYSSMEGKINSYGFTVWAEKSEVKV